jgi:hypothetical protein
LSKKNQEIDKTIADFKSKFKMGDAISETKIQPTSATMVGMRGFSPMNESKILKLNEFKSLIKRIIKEEKEKENDTYFETLSQALDAVRDKATKMGYEANDDDIFTNFGTGGISYEKTKSANIGLLKNGEPIMDKRGKEMNRSLSVSIYRMPSGKYELTMYKTF